MLGIFKTRKPKWLYESLPYVYIASGVLTFLLLRNAIAFFSGLPILRMPVKKKMGC